MEASALPASPGLTRPRIAIGASLLRLRSDEQLVSLFRDGNEDAFRVIHDRYRVRLLAYARQMLSASGQDSEDALQEIFVRAYYGLRSNRRDLALRPWLYRIAHNRCVDDLRRHLAVPMDPVETPQPAHQDPAVRAEQRDTLRRLIADVQRLPEQQRSALLMRELSGMSYVDVAGALDVSVPAVKSLLVRARVGLAQASAARNIACSEIRQDLILAHDRGVRASGVARRHMRECEGCREFRSEVRGVSRQLAALAPTLGPLGVIAKLLGLGGGGTAASSSMAGGGAAAGGATASAASAGLLAGGAGHVVTLLAAAVVTAGGAVELQHSFSAPAVKPAHHAALAHRTPRATGAGVLSAATGSATGATGYGLPASSSTSTGTQAATGPGTAPSAGRAGVANGLATSQRDRRLPITQILDPDQLLYATSTPAATSPAAPAGTVPPTTGTGTSSPASGTTPTGTPAAPAPANPATGTSPPSGTAGGSTSSQGTSSSTGTSGSSAPTGTGSDPGSSTGQGSTGGAGSSQTSRPTTTTSVGKSVSGRTGASARVVSFVSSHRSVRHHGFALGTLLAP